MAFNPDWPEYRGNPTSLGFRDNFNALAQHHRGATAPGAGSPGLGWVWVDTSDDDNWVLKVYSRHGAGAPSWKTLFEHVEQTPFSGSDVEQQQVLYVGKHGADTNNGKTLGKAFLTIGAAITAAGAPVDGASAVTIHVMDGGTYTENLAHVPFVNVHAPNATIKGEHTFGGTTCLSARRLTNNGDTGHILWKLGGASADRVIVNAQEIVHTGIGLSAAGIGALLFGTMFVQAQRIIQAEGDGFLAQCLAPDLAVLYLDVDEWDVGTAVVGGNPSALGCNADGARIYGRIGTLLGGPTSAGIDVGQFLTGTAVYLTVGKLSVAGQAYNVRGGNSLRLFVGELSGTEVIADGADVRVVKARRDGVKAGVPGITDDESDGYQRHSMVYDSNAGDMYVCCDPSAGAAVWKKTTP